MSILVDKDTRTINFVEHKRLPDTIKLYNSWFEYTPAKGWAWLQRLCFRFLEWRKCFAHEEIQNYKSYVLERKTLLDYIRKQYRKIQERYYLEGFEIVMGPSDYHELRLDPEIRNVMDFEFRLTDEERRMYPHGKVFGMRVRIVPWMTGCLVLPK